MQRIMKLVNGNKTYIGTIALGILGLLWANGVISDATASQVGILVGTFTGVSAAHKGNKVISAIKDATGETE